MWSASSGMAALQRGLDIAYELPSDRRFLARRLVAIPLMLATLVLGGIGAALIVFGKQIGSGIQGHMPFDGAGFDIIWTVVRWVLAVCAIALLVSVYYYLAPNRPRARWQWVSTGGLLATVIFLIASVGFSLYVTESGCFSRTYGAFAGGVILILWFYLIGIAVVTGAEINAHAERQRPQQPSCAS